MTTGLDFSYNEDQQAIRAAIDRFCAQHNVEEIARQPDGPFPRELWRELAEQGVFYPASPDSPEAGGALEVCAIAETLGRHVFPGPIGPTYLAIQLLDGAERDALQGGRALVSLSCAGSTLLPWGTAADIFLTVDESTIARAVPPAHIEPAPTLGGDSWARAVLRIDRTLPDATRGLVLANIATAAYLASAGWQLLMDASAYAATRRQFGKTLGEFQAVAHPLADCAIRVSAAQTLARAAACSADRAGFDGGADRVECDAATALFCARRAALNAAYACHQVFAGIGITLEGPAFHITRRIRQVASTPPLGGREEKLLLAEVGLGA